MKRLCHTLLFLLVMAVATPAQEPLITADTQVDSGTLHQWLHSGDPRLIAWAADFARTRHDAKIVAEMPEWLEHSAMPRSYGGDEWQAAHRRAVLAVLDTVIQENAQVPIPAIGAVARSFPAQAGILISRHPLSEARDTLDEWIVWGGPILARMATMMFAKDPEASGAFWNEHAFDDLGLVASVVADSETELRITVAADSAVRPLGGGAACGDSLGRPLSPGWPQVYAYELAENDSNANGPVIVDVGGDRIATWRFKENGGWGSCHYPQRLDPYTRHQLIAYWLGMKDEDMSWKPVEPFTIKWAGKPAYQRHLGKIIESQRKKLQATVDALLQRGLLTEREATLVAPKLVVNIQCDMNPCPLQ